MHTRTDTDIDIDTHMCAHAHACMHIHVAHTQTHIDYNILDIQVCTSYLLMHFGSKTCMMFKKFKAFTHYSSLLLCYIYFKIVCI